MTTENETAATAIATASHPTNSLRDQEINIMPPPDDSPLPPRAADHLVEAQAQVDMFYREQLSMQPSQGAELLGELATARLLILGEAIPDYSGCLMYPCLMCGAAPNMPCSRPGLPVSWPHEERIRLADPKHHIAKHGPRERLENKWFNRLIEETSS